MRKQFPNHENQLARLGKIEGQLRGIRKMVEERRYCIDIISQIKAVTGALEAVQLGILETHVHHCVKEALEERDGTLLEEKVEEIVKVLGKMG